LNGKGKPCNLITGEEVRIVEATVDTYSTTIEMAKYGKDFECAVIDEIQMIADSERGGAWTNALLGIPSGSWYGLWLITLHARFKGR
jgi:ATP-dependent RNA helicase SUPV3L1/SUV3